VVLIHGPNGAGKTSLLSAIELGLTGAVASLGRSDKNYVAHLPHKSGNKGEVTLSLTGISSEQALSANLIVTTEGIQKTPLLNEELSRFFTERCYLAQSILSRLLEIYQHQDARKTDSALTRFVKDLLGLDRLDALIDGLHPAGDVRRLRASAPSYWVGKEDIPVLEQKVRALSSEERTLDEEIVLLKQRIKTNIGLINLSNDVGVDGIENVEDFLSRSSVENLLQESAFFRRDLQAIQKQWNTLLESTASFDRKAVEDEERNASGHLEAWRQSAGKLLESIVEELRPTFPELPSPSVVGPMAARTAALTAVSSELARLDALLAKNVVDTKRLIDIEQSIEAGKARIAVLDAQIEQGANLTEGLTQALAQLASHIHSDDCPVCGRNYQEVSSTPLQAHISNRIAELTEQASRLQALANDKARTSGLLVAAGRERSEIRARELNSEIRDQLKTKKVRLQELNSKLIAFEESAVQGAQLQQHATDLAKRLSAYRTRDDRSPEIRFALSAISEKLGQLPVPATEAFEDAIARILAYLLKHEEVLLERQEARRSTIEDLRSWKLAVSRKATIVEQINTQRAKLEKLQDAKAEADRRLDVAKALAKSARAARTAIVRRVFNEELNKVWRDLFIRLAPEEPFVPAFALPKAADGPVEAVLETLYRNGGKGGDPRAMLSAGNLNTAALTLFLSLHLSVKPMLPWVIIDDPVQSMDEVHISQFAALLRTLSKQHGRQVIIAVHERPLFDYLALELSPAYPDDRLITIELSRASNGMMAARYEPKIFVPDNAITA
jgi:exonuclease SbcC